MSCTTILTDITVYTLDMNVRQTSSIGNEQLKSSYERHLSGARVALLRYYYGNVEILLN